MKVLSGEDVCHRRGSAGSPAVLRNVSQPLSNGATGGRGQAAPGAQGLNCCRWTESLCFLGPTVREKEKRARFAGGETEARREASGNTKGLQSIQSPIFSSTWVPASSSLPPGELWLIRQDSTQRYLPWEPSNLKQARPFLSGLPRNSARVLITGSYAVFSFQKSLKIT